MKAAAQHPAFTLVELVVVILVLGILAGVASKRFFNSQQDAAEEATVTQVLEIFRAAELYYVKHGAWPANTDAGDFPAEFEGVLPESIFTRPSPIGRYFDWNGPGTGMPNYGVSIPPPVPVETIQSIDDKHDDGNLRKGWITRTPSGSINFELIER
ncbi:MAG: prepilin-type N-terminal cleavage/methylation domain-containing protein [Planctomycetota bacterium]